MQGDVPGGEALGLEGVIEGIGRDGAAVHREKDRLAVVLPAKVHIIPSQLSIRRRSLS